MKNIYLVGFMGTGKTEVAQLLAKSLNKQFVEMDEEIQKQAGKTIVDIFSQDGEATFRTYEKDLLKSLSLKEDLIVSCGGGLVCDQENLEILNGSGLVFCLKAKPITIYERLKDDTTRPLLCVKDPLAKIEGLLEKRKSYYDQARFSIDTDQLTKTQVAESIIATIKDN